MDWNKDLAADLPARRDDEPQSLRDDIVAELQDHLACALHRERHATGDEDRAQKNVIEKFGNPAAIAYRLWWDAMKEKIMSQRILIGTVLLLAIACLAATGFAWIAVQEGREVNRVMMENSRAMMEKLSEMTVTGTEHSKSLEPAHLDWVPVTVKLLASGEGRVPEEEYEVSLLGKLFGADEEIFSRKVRLNQEVEMGYVKPGACNVSVRTPWNEFFGGEKITVAPGVPQTVTIVCPTEPVGHVDLQFDINWPAELQDNDLQLICAVSYEPRQLNEKNWFPSSEGWNIDQSMSSQRFNPLILQHDGKAAESPSPIDYSFYDVKSEGYSEWGYSISLTESPIYDNTLSVLELPVKISWLGVVFSSVESLEGRLEDGLVVDGEGMPLAALWPHNRYLVAEGDNPSSHQLSIPIPVAQLAGFEGRMPQKLFLPREITSADESTEPLRFVPQPGEENVWTIELPESLIARTREALQAIDDFKAEHAAAVETSGGE